MGITKNMGITKHDISDRECCIEKSTSLTSVEKFLFKETFTLHWERDDRKRIFRAETEMLYLTSVRNTSELERNE